MQASPGLSFGDSLEPAQPTDYPKMAVVIARCLREVNIKDYPPDEIELLVDKYSAEKLGTYFAGKYVLAFNPGATSA